MRDFYTQWIPTNYDKYFARDAKNTFARHTVHALQCYVLLANVRAKSVQTSEVPTGCALELPNPRKPLADMGRTSTSTVTAT